MMTDEEVPKILVVDDDEELLNIIEDYLQDFEVIKATNGKEAIQLYKEYKPDIVLMDIVMPEMDGIDTTKEIKKIDPNATVLAMTGHASTKKQDAINAGVQTVLAKPIRLPNLLAQIETYVQRISYDIIQNRLAKVEQTLMEVIQSIHRIEQQQMRITTIVEKAINKLVKGIVSLYNIILFVIMILQRITSSENFKVFLQQNRNLIIMTGVGIGLILIIFVLPSVKSIPRLILKKNKNEQKPRFVLTKR